MSSIDKTNMYRVTFLRPVVIDRSVDRLDLELQEMTKTVQMTEEKAKNLCGMKSLPWLNLALLEESEMWFPIESLNGKSRSIRSPDLYIISVEKV